MNRFKLNNRGWGLQVMIASILVLMLGLVIVAILIQQTFGDVFDPIDENNPSSGINRPNEQPEESETYDDLEDLVLEATKKYQQEYYSDILDGEIISVTIKQLINEKLIDEVNDVEDGSPCTGYGIFTLKDGEITYNAYLNCNNYQTTGYNTTYDN